MMFLRRFWWAILIALAIVWLPFMAEIAKRAFPPDRQTEAPAGPDISALREDVARLRDEVRDLAAALEDERARGGARDAEIARLYEGGAQDRLAPKTRTGIENRFAAAMLLTGRRNVNAPLESATSDYLEALFGPPRLARDFSDECQAPDNPRLVANLALEDVGPFRVRMLKPALESLRRIFKAVKEFEPDLYEVIGSRGSLCGRLIRGSEDRVSAHAYGTAVDVTIDGALDVFGDGSSQLGLILLAEYFQEEGWYWGAAFSREDSMHFEVSRQTLESWREDDALDLTIPFETVTR